jgi:hypothetical protein
MPEEMWFSTILRYIADKGSADAVNLNALADEVENTQGDLAWPWARWIVLKAFIDSLYD